MGNSLIEGLKKNFKINYNRVYKVLKIEPFEEYFGLNKQMNPKDYIDGFIEMCKDMQKLKGSWDKRQEAAAKNLVFLMKKICDMESPGWDKKEVEGSDVPVIKFAESRIG